MAPGSVRIVSYTAPRYSMGTASVVQRISLGRDFIVASGRARMLSDKKCGVMRIEEGS